MKFTYTLSREDAVAVNKVTCRRLAVAATTTKTRVGLFALNVLAWMAIAYTSAAYVSLYKRYPQLTSSLSEVLIALGAAIALLVAGYVYRQNLYRELVFSDASWPRATQSVSAAPEGLEVVTSGASSRFDWSSFKDCMEDQKMLYLFLDSSYAVVIPKDAFSTPEELAQFRSWAERSSKSSQAPHEDARA